MGFLLSVDVAIARFGVLGCSQVFIKILSSKQDNEKNQIYLGSRMEIFSVLPGKVSVGLPSASGLKRKSRKGEAKLELELDFHWLTEKSHAKAPRAKLINYFQYPEIRFSGFLTGCNDAPDSLRRSRQAEYGQRVLLLGVVEDRVYGLVLNSLENGNLSRLLTAPYWLNQELIRVVSTGERLEKTVDSSLLLGEISQLVGIEHPAQSLKNGDSKPVPWRGTQGAGYTLEALLGVPRNGNATPDKYGFEIKSTLSSPITLITTQPDGGIRGKNGLKKFLELFGWVGAKEDGSLRFNGKHSPKGSTPRSGLELVVKNWSTALAAPEGTSEPVVQLLDKKTGVVAAEWTFSKLGASWSRKHAGAIYVEAKSKRKDAAAHPSHYVYGPKVYLCTGTSAAKLLQAIVEGVVYLDSGDRLHSDGSAKSRTQWRMGFSKKTPLESKLATLYDTVKVIEY